MPIYPDAEPADVVYKVADLWLYAPVLWVAHIDITICHTAVDLIKLAADKDEQLQASSPSSIMRTVRSELQKQGLQLQPPRRQFGAHVIDWKDDNNDGTEESTRLEAEAKTSEVKEDFKAPGKFLYPLAANRSKKVPPRPCRNCGSPLHYDRDCASWRSQGRPEGKPTPNSKLYDAYQKSYIAMLEEDDASYDTHYASFSTTITNNEETDVFVAESNPDAPFVIPIKTERELELSEYTEGKAWTAIPMNLSELEQGLDRPAESVFEPARAWERPAGHAVQGVDAFKLLCHVNSLKEPAAVVIGDSGAAPTLIFQSFLDSLQCSKPKPRAGRKLKLLQLTGTAACSEYVRLNLYFQSQLGPVCLKGVEAYVVKGMVANMLIGEDTQLAWQLHTIRNDGKRHWKVGESLHRIPGIPGPAPVESFAAEWVPPEPTKEDKRKPTVSPRSTSKRTRLKWNAIAQHDLTLLPESIATITVVAKGAPIDESLYLEGIALKRGSDDFVCAPHGIVELDSESHFQIKIANATKRRIRVRSGELLGHLTKALDTLSSADSLTKDKLDLFTSRATQLAAMIPELDTLGKQNATETASQPDESEDPRDTEHLGWGPKTTDPGPEQIYPSDKLREVIDVDPTLSSEQRDALYQVVENNQAAFGFDGRLGHLDSKVHIQLVPDTKPISMPPYHASPAKREIIDKQIDLWLSQDVIEESKSPWGAPVIIVHRNDKPRLCIDWRKLNKATVADQHPIPKQTDILQALSGTQYLSVFDALSGFTQMEFDEESRPITAIRTHRGLHHFKRMPFGWRNGPPEFQRAMQEILSPYLWVFTLVYIDDIVVYSRTFEDHLRHVELVLRAIAESGLTLSPPKCHVGYRSIIVLGNKVSRLGLSTHHEKLKAVWELEAPKDRKRLESFLGLAVYFAAYIPYFSWMAAPLFKRMRQADTFEWTENHQKSFEFIKLALISAPVRGHPEAGQTYRLYTDASDYAIAGALQQIQYIAIKDLKGTRTYKKLREAYERKDPPMELVHRLSKEFDDKRPTPGWSPDWEDPLIPVERVIAYWSRVLIPAETRYSATEREALAAKESLVRFQPFIEGEKILLITDHAALTWAKTYENANRRLAAWGLVFAAFPELVIVHRPGRIHSNVDPLSRLPRIPAFTSPARNDLPSPDTSTEHDQLQESWETFLKERDLAHELESKATKVARKGLDATATEVRTSDREGVKQDASMNDETKGVSALTASLHVHASP